MNVPVVQLRWDQRTVEAPGGGRVSLRIPARFANVVIWWRFKGVLDNWQDASGELDLVVLDPDWLLTLSERRAPDRVVFLIDPAVLEDEGYRLRHALHELAISLDDASRYVD